jgi:FkbM family methyltransferase
MVLEICGPSGTYLDIGAHDGVEISNTLRLHELGWTGYCVEGNPDSFAACQKNRNQVLNYLVTDKDNEFLLFAKDGVGSYIVKEYIDPQYMYLQDRNHQPIKLNHAFNQGNFASVPTIRLDTLLQKYYPNHPTYISLDIEGEEMNVLKSIDLSAINTKVWSVEHNAYAYTDGTARANKMIGLFRDCGYKCLVADCDFIFYKA